MTVEKAWWQRFASREHDGTSQTPHYVAYDSTKTMWTEPSCEEDCAVNEAVQYKRMYEADAQFVFSRVQHHIHKKTKDAYVPLPRTCVSGKSKGLCKHDVSKVKQLNLKGRVIYI